MNATRLSPEYASAVQYQLTVYPDKQSLIQKKGIQTREVYLTPEKVALNPTASPFFSEEPRNIEESWEGKLRVNPLIPMQLPPALKKKIAEVAQLKLQLAGAKQIKSNIEELNSHTPFTGANVEHSFFNILPPDLIELDHIINDLESNICDKKAKIAPDLTKLWDEIFSVNNESDLICTHSSSKAPKRD